jgi:tRNA U55 pseudouridine synthase TruB
MNPESISPELAAMIVKKYVLPMFESKERKTLKSKYNKMTSIGTQKLKYGKTVNRAEEF